ncbi:unnamed protein product [Bursaphelenchus xylophilus]|uniref:(pine wood nematode) hypothetical protein n=1 Tax=Bursaphelenchus xylophilus TaxID=6326 RepID=A0A1I7RV98_BURXY|nr:unnamed protein product [Bursaphelenchus xylophilus]CAG9086580.1 unnamed protein product [Bursaphelenchus xylophilus]
MNVQKTQMTHEFAEAIKAYDDYQQLAEDLAEKLQNVVQQNPPPGGFEAPPNEHPMEKVSNSLNLFATYLPAEKQPSVQATAEECKKLAQFHRQHQIKVNECIKNLLAFKETEYKELMQERKQLDKAREYMDTIKDEVKRAKTTEQVEKKAAIYEEAVTSFDQQATKVISLLEKLPEIKKTHQKELCAFFEAHLKYNEEVVKATMK